MSVWYVAHENELLIDLDDYRRAAPSKTGESRGPWGEIFFRRRLADAIRAKRLDVSRVFLERSNSQGHWHAVIQLNRTMALIERLVWQLRLGSDLMRGQCDLMRAAQGIEHPSLIIRSREIEGFYRAPDRICRCTRKHDTDEQYRLGEDACPVWRELRGATPWELFGQTHPGNQFGVSLPEGEVPLSRILEIRQA